ncbi:MAG: sugar phosphate isomerase/epimerase [Armatimonadetes bacterium]|nr:sugar phosphate isomerase/epimerase [Candidatus Hippobium faecium]
MKIGIINGLENQGKCFDKLVGLGLDTCQLCGWDFSQMTDECIENVKNEITEKKLNICAFWAGWSGNQHWDLIDGPLTLGIVPVQYRARRIRELKQWIDFAHKIGLKNVITHFGFIPENICDPNYWGVVDAIKELAEYALQYDMGLWFETGQETPIVILRTIEAVGTGNLGINLDPANLILYGKGNPVDALDVFGKYVKNIHVKDALPPTCGTLLGTEVAPGEGAVRFPVFMQKLKKIGFSGEFIIEREISGEQQIKDMKKTIIDLQEWWK